MDLWDGRSQWQFKTRELGHIPLWAMAALCSCDAEETDPGSGMPATKGNLPKQ